MKLLIAAFFSLFTFWIMGAQAITSDFNQMEAGFEESTESVVKADLLQRTKAGKLITSAGTYKTLGVEVVDNRPAKDRYSGKSDAKVMLIFDNDVLTQAIIYK